MECLSESGWAQGPPGFRSKPDVSKGCVRTSQYASEPETERLNL